MVDLFCRVRGIPAPTITWLKNGQPLSATSHISISTTPPIFVPSEEEAEFAIRSSTLLIQELVLGDDATYVCRAENTGAPGNTFTVDSDPANISVECKTHNLLCVCCVVVE